MKLGRIALGIGIIAAIFGISKVNRLRKAGQEISIRLARINKLDVGGTGIGGYVKFTVDVLVSNPTNEVLKVRIPAAKIFFNGNEIANTVPIATATTVAASSQKEINGIVFQVPYQKVFNSGLLLNALSWKKNTSYWIKCEVNGIMDEFAGSFNQEAA